MRKLLSIILTALVTVNLGACGPLGTAGESVKLPTVYLAYYADGGLMSFGEYTYEFDNAGHIVKECYYSGGSIANTTERNYSDSGIITDESYYGFGNRLESYKEFDEEGNLAKETFYKYGDEVTEIDLYNSDGLLICKESFDYSHYIVRFEYDEAGILIGEYEEDYDENDNIKYTYEDTYDSEGNLIKRIITDADGNSYEAAATQIDEDGNKRVIYQYGADGEIMFRTEEEYDDDGNLLSKVSYAVYDGDRVLSCEEYSYDDEGRVIDKIYELVDVTETRYEYSDEGYLYKESRISESYYYPQVYSDGSDGIPAEIMTVDFYDADGDKIRNEYYVAGVLTSYSVWEFETIDTGKYAGKELDYRDDERELDERATRVY